MTISDSVQKVSFPYEPNMYVQPTLKPEAIEQVSQIQPSEEDFLQRKELAEDASMFPDENRTMKGSVLDVYV